MLAAKRLPLQELRTICYEQNMRFHISTIKHFDLNGDYVVLDEVKETRLRAMWRTGYFYPVRNGSGAIQKYEASIPVNHAIGSVRWNLSEMPELDYRTIRDYKTVSYASYSVN